MSAARPTGASGYSCSRRSDRRGAGRDVLYATSGGDRLADWTGEFNSYIVSYSPFGPPTVARLLQPDLEAFLYALSKSQGADQTLAAQYGGAPGRNGEPFGELGLVRQQDAAWNDQTGGPRDPQAGNNHNGRDVRLTAGSQPLWETAADPAPRTAHPPRSSCRSGSARPTRRYASLQSPRMAGTSPRGGAERLRL